MDATKKIEQTGKQLKKGAKEAYSDKTEIVISVLAVTAGIIFGVMVMHKVLGDTGSVAAPLGVPVPDQKGWLYSSGR